MALVISQLYTERKNHKIRVLRTWKWNCECLCGSVCLPISPLPNSYTAPLPLQMHFLIPSEQEMCALLILTRKLCAYFALSSLIKCICALRSVAIQFSCSPLLLPHCQWSFVVALRSTDHWNGVVMLEIDFVRRASGGLWQRAGNAIKNL